MLDRAALGCRASTPTSLPKVQENLVSHALGKIGSPELPKRIPSVAEQLREMGRRIAGLRPVQVGSSAAARLSDSHRLKSAVFQLR